MQAVDPLLEEFVESLPTTPAIVTDDSFDVLASNALARAVSPSLNVGANLARATFENVSARRTLPQWNEVSARMAELMKAQPLPDSYALDVTMQHPEVGRLDITYEVLRLTEARQIVILGHAAPGSESEQRLFTLAAQSEST